MVRCFFPVWCFFDSRRSILPRTNLRWLSGVSHRVHLWWFDLFSRRGDHLTEVSVANSRGPRPLGAIRIRFGAIRIQSPVAIRIRFLILVANSDGPRSCGETRTHFPLVKLRWGKCEIASKTSANYSRRRQRERRRGGALRGGVRAAAVRLARRSPARGSARFKPTTNPQSRA